MLSAVLGAPATKAFVQRPFSCMTGAVNEADAPDQGRSLCSQVERGASCKINDSQKVQPSISHTRRAKMPKSRVDNVVSVSERNAAKKINYAIVARYLRDDKITQEKTGCQKLKIVNRWSPSGRVPHF